MNMLNKKGLPPLHEAVLNIQICSYAGYQDGVQVLLSAPKLLSLHLRRCQQVLQLFMHQQILLFLINVCKDPLYNTVCSLMISHQKH